MLLVYIFDSATNVQRSRQVQHFMSPQLDMTIHIRTQPLGYPVLASRNLAPCFAGWPRASISHGLTYETCYICLMVLCWCLMISFSWLLDQLFELAALNTITCVAKITGVYL